MGTTVEELKKLYIKLGGKDKQVATFNQPGEILNAINEIDLPTDYELPKVTTTDVGKVLTVSDEGKWDAEEAGEKVPFVIGTLSNSTTIGTFEQTQQELYNLFRYNGGTISLVGGQAIYNVVWIFNVDAADDTHIFLRRLAVSSTNSSYIVFSFNIYKNNTTKTVDITKEIYDLSDELPSVSASDNGKVLGVVEGAWGAVSPSGGGGNVVIVDALWNRTGKYIDFSPLSMKDVGDLINSGKDVIIRGTTSDRSLTIIFRLFSYPNSGSIMFFNFDYGSTSTIIGRRLSITSTSSYTSSSYAEYSINIQSS